VGPFFWAPIEDAGETPALRVALLGAPAVFLGILAN